MSLPLLLFAFSLSVLSSPTVAAPIHRTSCNGLTPSGCFERSTRETIPLIDPSVPSRTPFVCLWFSLLEGVRGCCCGSKGHINSQGFTSAFYVSIMRSGFERFEGRTTRAWTHRILVVRCRPLSVVIVVRVHHKQTHGIILILFCSHPSSLPVLWNVS